MTDISAVGFSSFDPWSTSLDDDVERLRAAGASPPKTAVRDVAELPEAPDTNGALLAMAARAAPAPRPLLATGIASGDVASVDAAATPAAPLQQRLDAFRAEATPTYRLPDGTQVKVAAPFRMPSRQTWQLTASDKKDDTTARYAAQEDRVVGHKAELATIASNAGIGPGGLVALYYGHGTPQQVRAVTQALVDAGKLPVGDGKLASASARMRQMMCDYGLGFDCAGYTQQAFLSAHGVTRAQAGFANPTSEGLSGLSPAHFARIAPEDVRPGDIVVLGPPAGESVGHRAIVSDRHELTATELRRFSCNPQDRARLQAGRVTVFEVDSSWGSSAEPQAGGVERHTWLYDATSGRWGTVSNGSAATVRLSDLPYGNHSLQGIYRYRGSR